MQYKNVCRIIPLREAVAKPASIHTLRYSFAAHLLEKGYDIRTIQELLGHKYLQTTMIYTDVATKNILGVRSPPGSMNCGPAQRFPFSPSPDRRFKVTGRIMI